MNRLAWVNVGGRCYKVVLEYGSPLGLDGRNMVVMHACRFCMCLMCIHGDGHCCSCVVM